MKYVIIVHLIGWFIAEVIDGCALAVAVHKTQKPMPDAKERLATNVELFFWEFTIIPALIGSWIAGLVIAKKEDE